MVFKNLILTSLFCVTLGSTAWGSSSFFCSHSNKYVQLSDTIDTVIQTCGIPNQTKNQVKKNQSQSVNVFQWIYNFHYQGSSPHRTEQASALIINFVKLKVVSIVENGAPVSSTSFCGPRHTIKVGDSNFTVRQLCGNPSIMQHIQQHVQQPPVTQTVFTYGNTQLSFENERLVSIQP